MRSPLLLFGTLGVLLFACRFDEPWEGRRGGPDPAQGEVPLGSMGGWDAFLVMDAGGHGVWTVRSFQVFPQYGSPEVVALDDLGRCNVLVSYSGRWSPLRAVHDGQWLAPVTQGRVDPRVEGPQLYTAGRRGTVYQVFGRRSGALDGRLVAELAGHEVHTLVAGELDPGRAGEELLAFTSPGRMCFLRPNPARDAFDVEWLQELEGRVRDAVLLPTVGGAAPWIATVSRAGKVELLRFTPEGPEWRLVHEEEMGMGRIALRPAALGAEAVLYSTCDDGRVLRHERGAGGSWSTELLFAGPQGPRGLAAGRFSDDPAQECVAVYGYRGAVQLLLREPGGWSIETIFESPGQGHWLAAAELDGRNATDELLCSGYAGRVVMLARPPGYGLAGVALDPEPASPPSR